MQNIQTLRESYKKDWCCKHRHVFPREDIYCTALQSLLYNNLENPDESLPARGT